MCFCTTLLDKSENVSYYAYCILYKLTWTDLILCYYVGVVIELLSDNGLINASEGTFSLHQFLVSGFSYAAIPVRASTLTYSEYAARGFNLADEFDSDVIPPDAADGMLSILMVH